jgi:carbon starvation protein
MLIFRNFLTLDFMELTLLALVFIAWLFFGYFGYGSWIARQFKLDPEKTTPANIVNDGVDFVPTKPFYLFGQHFSAISAAGPIAGPILACQQFGWLPSLLWIALGVVIIGAVHDFSALTSSIRHGAQSIAEITKDKLGKNAGRAMLGFIWISIVYVVTAFTDLTAGTFVSGTEELAGNVSFNPGGAVAMAAVLYLSLAVILGLVNRFLNPPLWLTSVIFVPAAFALAYLGKEFSTVFILDHLTWGIIILIYCIIGSIMPVWLLLQPRGYLGGFILYFAIAAGVFGILFGGFEIVQPAFVSWDVGGMTGMLFPFMFVTIACGACSGFHGLMCSGTTSKQLDNETHAHPIGYGAMLAEGFVAFIALATIMILTTDAAKGLAPGAIYGQGIGEFLAPIVGRENVPLAVTFGAMAFSTFVFDTLDVCLRLGRYIVQEITGLQGKAGALVGTLVTVAIPFFIVFYSKPGSWLQFWTVFGASNQLLAALTLLSISVWLYQARKRIAFTLIPMIFVLAVTLTALSSLAYQNLTAIDELSLTMIDPSLINGIASLALIILALYLVGTALLKVKVLERTAPKE